MAAVTICSDFGAPKIKGATILIHTQWFKRKLNSLLESSHVFFLCHETKKKKSFGEDSVQAR